MIQQQSKARSLVHTTPKKKRKKNKGNEKGKENELSSGLALMDVPTGPLPPARCCTKASPSSVVVVVVVVVVVEE